MPSIVEFGTVVLEKIDTHFFSFSQSLDMGVVDHLNKTTPFDSKSLFMQAHLNIRLKAQVFEVLTMQAKSHRRWAWPFNTLEFSLGEVD